MPPIIIIPTTIQPKTPPITVLDPPSDLIPTNVTSNGILLLWTSVKPGPHPVTYIVEYKKANQPSSKPWKMAGKSIAADRFFVTGLAARTRYIFSVKSKTKLHSSKRTLVQVRTRHQNKVVPVATEKPFPIDSAKVLVNVVPVSWNKLNITWRVSWTSSTRRYSLGRGVETSIRKLVLVSQRK